MATSTALGRVRAIADPRLPCPSVQRLSAQLADLLDRRLVVRYLVTSLVNVINHQVVLQVAVRAWGWSGGWANAFAACVAVIPAYLLSRYWVWQVQGKPSVRRELIPFWMIALLGLVASTALASAADRLFDRPIMISVGSLAGYFVVWVLKFMVLDRLFRQAEVDQPVAV